LKVTNSKSMAALWTHQQARWTGQQQQLMRRWTSSRCQCVRVCVWPSTTHHHLHHHHQRHHYRRQHHRRRHPQRHWRSRWQVRCWRCRRVLVAGPETSLTSGHCTQVTHTHIVASSTNTCRTSCAVCTQSHTLTLLSLQLTHTEQAVQSVHSHTHTHTVVSSTNTHRTSCAVCTQSHTHTHSHCCLFN